MAEAPPHPPAGLPPGATAVLTIDLDAVAANYRLLRERLGAVPCAAVVKADAYGLGLAPVVRRLLAEDCDTFFTATLDEGVAARAVAPAATIAVLAGLGPREAPALVEHGLVPVLNDLGQIEAWRDEARRLERALAAMVHIDTGMNRLGLDARETARLIAEPDRLGGLDLRLWISHFACADEPYHPLNATQIERFRSVRRHLPPAPASLANSSGVFLGEGAHGDLARPGAALYGLRPTAGRRNPLARVVTLAARVLKVRRVEPGTTVGYGATHAMPEGGRVATIALGYADGYLRHLSNRGTVQVGEQTVPVVGRISMDLTTIDVSALAPGTPAEGDWVTVIGERQSPDQVAEAAHTIGYEILTSLGRRYVRHYLGEAA